MRNCDNVENVIFDKVNERIRVRWKYVTMGACEILGPLRRSFDHLRSGVIELAEKAGFSRFAPRPIPSPIFFNLGGRFLEEFEVHQRLGRCK